MGTSCLVARQCKDSKKIEVNRINWDGYPSYVGNKLETYFNSPEKLDEFFSKKQIRCIEDDNTIEFYPESIDIVYSDFDVFLNKIENSMCDYCYFFKDKWYQVPMRYDLEEIPRLQKGQLYPIGHWGS